MKQRQTLLERWIEGEGRLGGDPRLAGKPGERVFPGDEKQPNFAPTRVCFRCGASSWKGAPLSGCSEKRGTGVPWKHEYYYPERDDPFRMPIDASTDYAEWRRMTLAELIAFARYLGLKSQGSLSAAISWTAIRDTFAPGPDDRAIQYAIALYREKAEKRGRLMSWVLNVIDRRLAAGETIPEPELEEEGEADGSAQDPG